MSVGHIARYLEENGIATVVIAVKSFEPRMRMMSLPRVLLTPHLLGRPMGSPGDIATQTRILEHAFRLFETSRENGTIVDYEL